MIRMTKQADYGAVLLTHFAKEPAESMLSARDLSERSSLPLPTVTKVLKLLAKSGILVSHRGVKGGYSLARDPRGITVEEIVTALEGPIALAQCAENAPGCEQESKCPIRPGWQRIDQAVRGALTSVTLADLVQPADAVGDSEVDADGESRVGAEAVG
jgi:FeS assembly SUF system regulator